MRWMRRRLRRHPHAGRRSTARFSGYGSLSMETIEDRATADSIRGRRPIVLIVLCGGQPTFTWLAVGDAPLRIGRDTHPGLELDSRMSREHVEIEWHDGVWTIRDC